eukprot:jgi/Ulvmu1/8343/UM042_0049.1
MAVLSAARVLSSRQQRTRESVVARMGKSVYQTRCNRGKDDGSMKVLEFYAGIGGMSSALGMAHAAGTVPAYEMLSAFDINPIANDVYSHNYGGSLVRTISKGFQSPS